MEVLTKLMTSRLYYSDYQREDIFKLLLYIIKADSSNPESYFKKNSLNQLEEISFLEARNVFNLVYNFLNKTSDVDYTPFPFLKPIFEYKNKDNGDKMEDWTLQYDSFKIQLKRVIPFTIKFLGKYFEAQTMYNEKFATNKSGEVLWSSAALNAKTVKMPLLKEETLSK